MKKFKLFGKKDDFEGVLATIYVKDGKVIVESQDSIVKEILETEINKAIEAEGGGLFAFTSKNNKKGEEDKLVAHILTSPPFVKASDEDFVEAVASLILVQYIERDKKGELIFNFRARVRDLGYKIFYGESRIVEE